ncbi:DUF3263 domain-containing protein [Plantactinospora sp. GCM10030261]|uniref:DUF3263 domain-containing protein n=1 Tax=Plantactinospora sp. GCM10030261 TaxID=3273420 RepID=UPI00360A85EA
MAPPADAPAGRRTVPPSAEVPAGRRTGSSSETPASGRSGPPSGPEAGTPVAVPAPREGGGPATAWNDDALPKAETEDTDAETEDAETEDEGRGGAGGTPGAGTEPPAGPTLTERERQILDFEGRWWRHAGAKEQAIRDTFDLSATRYYQLLNALLDNPAALVAEPVLIGRLRRLRSTRSRNRRR